MYLHFDWSNIMKQIFLAASFLLTVSAVSAAPHFVKGPSASLDNEGSYVVSFKEAGLGNTPVTYVLTAANQTFTFQCFNPAGNQPQGDPNGQDFSNESQFVTLTPRNGQITGSVSLSPQTGTAGCQGNAMKLCLIAVSYSGVTFQDLTNGVPTPPASLPSLSEDYSSKPICGF